MNFLHALRAGNRYAWLWTLTVMSTLVASGALLLAPYLFTKLSETQDATDRAMASNHALTCSLGDLVQIGGGAPRQAATVGPTSHLEAELDFLRTILSAGCPLVLEQAKREIARTIVLIERELQRRTERNP